MARQPLGAVILHGFTSSLDCVSPVQAPVEALGLPTRMPVLRGHGAESPDALRGVVWQDWVDDAEAALQDLLTEVECSIVIGHSMGALATLMLAAPHAGDGTSDSIIVVAPAVQLASPVAPEGAEVFYAGIATPAQDRGIVWFEETEHEMLRDCER